MLLIKTIKSGALIMQGYVLFMLTLNLGNRKSESYALQWKHIDFEKSYASLIQSRDKFDNMKSTKGRKATKFKFLSFY